MCIREVLQYHDSTDSKVLGSGIAVKTSRKWRAEGALEQTKSCLCHGLPVGAVARERAGLDTHQSHYYDKVWGQERQQLI